MQEIPIVAGIDHHYGMHASKHFLLIYYISFRIKNNVVILIERKTFITDKIVFRFAWRNNNIMFSSYKTDCSTTECLLVLEGSSNIIEFLKRYIEPEKNICFVCYAIWIVQKLYKILFRIINCEKTILYIISRLLII